MNNSQSGLPANLPHSVGLGCDTWNSYTTYFSFRPGWDQQITPTTSDSHNATCKLAAGNEAANTAVVKSESRVKFPPTRDDADWTVCWLLWNERVNTCTASANRGSRMLGSCQVGSTPLRQIGANRFCSWYGECRSQTPLTFFWSASMCPATVWVIEWSRQAQWLT